MREMRETKKKAARKSTAPEIQVPRVSSSPPNRSSESPELFDFSIFNNEPSSKIKKPNIASTPTISPPPPQKTLTTTSDLKDLASSRLSSIKRSVDRSHSEILKELEASQSRIHKRFKMQTQACQQLTGDAEKEYKKMCERINESREAMMASYTEFMAEVQVSASRVGRFIFTQGANGLREVTMKPCYSLEKIMLKTSIPELSQCLEKKLDSLHSRFGIPSKSR